MKARITIAAGALALALAGSATLLSTQSSSSTTRSPAAAATPATATPSRTAAVPVLAAARTAPVADIAHPAAPLPPVKLTAAQAIAMVDGAQITGRQLLAWRAGAPGEQELTGEMFASPKSRAIERELAVAEARRQGTELTA